MRAQRHLPTVPRAGSPRHRRPNTVAGVAAAAPKRAADSGCRGTRSSGWVTSLSKASKSSVSAANSRRQRSPSAPSPCAVWSTDRYSTAAVAVVERVRAIHQRGTPAAGRALRGPTSAGTATPRPPDARLSTGHAPARATSSRHSSCRRPPPTMLRALSPRRPPGPGTQQPPARWARCPPRSPKSPRAHRIIASVCRASAGRGRAALTPLAQRQHTLAKNREHLRPPDAPRPKTRD